jgi:hypothetical protein
MTIAVLLIDMMPPRASAVCHETFHQLGSSQREQQRADGGQQHGQATCDSPSPKTCCFMARSLGRLNSRPITNIRKDDAEFGQVADAAGTLRQCQRMRADEHAGDQVTEHRRQLELAAGDDGEYGGEQIEQGDVE